jgi:hypothetical protein
MNDTQFDAIMTIMTKMSNDLTTLRSRVETLEHTALTADTVSDHVHSELKLDSLIENHISAKFDSADFVQSLESTLIAIFDNELYTKMTAHVDDAFDSRSYMSESDCDRMIEDAINNIEVSISTH